MFDSAKLVVLRGSMLSFTNMNPHGWISIEPKSMEKEIGAQGYRVDIADATCRNGHQERHAKYSDKVTAGIRPYVMDGARALLCS
jgi:hypothetical protein